MGIKVEVLDPRFAETDIAQYIRAHYAGRRIYKVKGLLEKRIRQNTYPPNRYWSVCDIPVSEYVEWLEQELARLLIYEQVQR